MLLVCRFQVAQTDAASFTDRADRALALLTAQPGCLRGALGRATEDGGRWVLTAQFASVAAYRRAMSPFEVREHVVPLLSEAMVDEPSGYETAILAEDGGTERSTSLVAADAATVAPGEAAGPAQPR